MNRHDFERRPQKYCLKQHQAKYYRRLSAIRTEGHWEPWVTFFLEGVASAAAAKVIYQLAEAVKDNMGLTAWNTASIGKFEKFKGRDFYLRNTLRSATLILS